MRAAPTAFPPRSTLSVRTLFASDSAASEAERRGHAHMPLHTLQRAAEREWPCAAAHSDAMLPDISRSASTLPCSSALQRLSARCCAAAARWNAVPARVQRVCCDVLVRTPAWHVPPPAVYVIERYITLGFRLPIKLPRLPLLPSGWHRLHVWLELRGLWRMCPPDAWQFRAAAHAWRAQWSEEWSEERSAVACRRHCLP